ncbi:MAG: type II toxin-antitoxin system ParD family antitoxin [Candidatus Methylumidiphilus alinenensis]|uniref:Antitoxin ParD n=1 Tax=Candidatus Methylumidiphilus alinenensis TaxID=2202197 RepID=A0A2W4SDP6_9GAMM|nr:MAG: type II toxin-antitoxin system ParD family antitoxin [Candidatus Methylumidiphilus alinenensis]
MSSVEKFNIALTPDIAATVRQAVESGDYASTGEVVRDALQDWKIKRQLHEQCDLELLKLWQEGIESGSAGILDMEEIKREARRLYDEKNGYSE